MIALSVVVPAEAAHDVRPALDRLAPAVASLGVAAEILVASPAPLAAPVAGVRHVPAPRSGYGAALAAGVAAARGAWILTIDADVLEPATVLRDLWARRDDADVVIASRYVPGGEAHMPAWRVRGSRRLNRLFGRGLSLGVRDMSSGVRLYRA